MPALLDVSKKYSFGLVSMGVFEARTRSVYHLVLRIRFDNLLDVTRFLLSSLCFVSRHLIFKIIIIAGWETQRASP